MKRKLPLFLAMFLLMSLLCTPMAQAAYAPSPGGGIEIEDPDVPLVEVPETQIAAGANGAVSRNDLLAAAQQVANGDAVRITISAAVGSKVTLPEEGVEAAAEAGAELQVITAVGQVTLPNAALASVAEAAGGADISIAMTAKSADQGKALLSGQNVGAALIEAGATVEVSITSGGSSITSWDGGSATVALPVSGSGFEEGMSYTVYQVDANGSVHTYVGRCVMVNGALQVVLSVNSMGTFVVIPGAVANSAAVADPTVVTSPLASKAPADNATGVWAAVQHWFDSVASQIMAMLGF